MKPLSTRLLLPLGLTLWLATGTVRLAAGELQDAVRAGDNALLEQRLKAQPQFVDLRDADGRTALHWAAKNGQLDAARLLIAYGAAVDLTDHTGKTPLMLAEAGGHAEIAAVLRQRGAGAVDFSKVNDSVLGGTTWCLFAGVVLFGLLIAVKILTRRKKTPEELLAEEMNDG